MASNNNTGLFTPNTQTSVEIFNMSKLKLLIFSHRMSEAFNSIKEN